MSLAPGGRDADTKTKGRGTLCAWEGQWVPTVPGECLGSERDFFPGSGTYVENSLVYSALLGYKVVSSMPENVSSKSEDANNLCSSSNRNGIGHCVAVLNQRSPHVLGSTVSDSRLSEAALTSWTDRLPGVGERVWCRISKVMPKVVYTDILMSDSATKDRVYTTPYKGHIKAHDVRTYDVDSMKLTECYRPGDVVYAQVISGGDSRGAFLLSTAPVECGVVFASSVSGGQLEPISYRFMRCDKTGLLEQRKVARPSGLGEDGIYGSNRVTYHQRGQEPAVKAPETGH